METSTGVISALGKFRIVSFATGSLVASNSPVTSVADEFPMDVPLSSALFTSRFWLSCSPLFCFELMDLDFLDGSLVSDFRMGPFEAAESLLELVLVKLFRSKYGLERGLSTTALLEQLSEAATAILMCLPSFGDTARVVGSYQFEG